jgi:Fic family protein
VPWLKQWHNEPEAMLTLMNGWARMANNIEGDVPPLVRAALVSFGFVFLHPFMDGNGRLSRLLAHHSLSLQQALPLVDGRATPLPLLVAMKRHEAAYLSALESFSRPARLLWDATWLTTISCSTSSPRRMSTRTGTARPLHASSPPIPSKRWRSH